MKKNLNLGLIKELLGNEGCQFKGCPYLVLEYQLETGEEQESKKELVKILYGRWPKERLRWISSEIERYQKRGRGIQSLRKITLAAFCNCLKELLGCGWFADLGVAIKFDKYCPPLLEELVKTPEELEKGKILLKKLNHQVANHTLSKAYFREVPPKKLEWKDQKIFEKYLQEVVEGAKSYEEFAGNLEGIIEDLTLCRKQIQEKITAKHPGKHVPSYCITSELIDEARMRRKGDGDFGVFFKPERGHREKIEEVYSDEVGYYPTVSRVVGHKGGGYVIDEKAELKIIFRK